jgi:hypothetical protein
MTHSLVGVTNMEIKTISTPLEWNNVFISLKNLFVKLNSSHVFHITNYIRCKPNTHEVDDSLQNYSSCYLNNYDCIALIEGKRHSSSSICKKIIPLTTSHELNLNPISIQKGYNISV